MIRIYLYKLLGEKKWTQKDLTRKTGIRAATINELYHELVERVSLEQLNKICDVLDCRLDELMEYVPDKKKKKPTKIWKE